MIQVQSVRPFAIRCNGAYEDQLQFSASRMVALKFRKASQKGATRAYHTLNAMRYDMLAARTRILINKNTNEWERGKWTTYYVRKMSRTEQYIWPDREAFVAGMFAFNQHRAICSPLPPLAAHKHIQNHYFIKWVDWSRPECSENKIVYSQFHKQTECALCIRT